MWPCLFPLVNSLVQDPPMNANRISWMAAALDGVNNGPLSSTLLFVWLYPNLTLIATWGSFLSCVLSDTMTEQVWIRKAIATYKEQRSWLKPGQFCLDFHKTELKAPSPGSKGPVTWWESAFGIRATVSASCYGPLLPSTCRVLQSPGNFRVTLRWLLHHPSLEAGEDQESIVPPPPAPSFSSGLPVSPGWPGVYCIA